jgi:hypothetical protein
MTRYAFSNRLTYSHKGWVGVRLDVKVDWNELAAIVKDGYMMSAPKRLGRRPAVNDAARSRLDPDCTSVRSWGGSSIQLGMGERNVGIE